MLRMNHLPSQYESDCFVQRLKKGAALIFLYLPHTFSINRKIHIQYRPGSLPVDSFFPEINTAGGEDASRPPQGCLFL